MPRPGWISVTRTPGCLPPSWRRRPPSGRSSSPTMSGWKTSSARQVTSCNPPLTTTGRPIRRCWSGWTAPTPHRATDRALDGRRSQVVDRPAAELVDPQSYDPVPDLVENIVGASQYISISYWIGWAIEQIFGTNPWMWVAEQFAGDYEAAQRAGIALKNLAEFNATFSAAVKNNTEAVIPAAWQGNAAESANEYFSKLSKALTDQVAELRSIGNEFETMAIGVYEAAAGFKGFFEMALDWAIIAAVEAAAAAATSWTVVGGIAGGIAT